MGKKVCFRKMEHMQKPQVMEDILETQIAGIVCLVKKVNMAGKCHVMRAGYGFYVDMFRG